MNTFDISSSTPACPGNQAIRLNRPSVSDDSEDDFLPFHNGVFLRLNATQFAGFGSESWQVFESLAEAGEFAKNWLEQHPTGKYKIYAADQRLVKTVLNGQPNGDLYAAWQASQKQSWWQFWKHLRA
jgi:hypothetical protein